MKISGFNNAVVLLDKPEGKTSFDLISAVKRITGIKKIGHSGTLDKFATGLMVICTGNATRLTRFFLEDDKRYSGRIQLGIETDTCDITGEVISEKSFSSIDWNSAADTLSQFTGSINQIPPKYSALKIDGKRASDRMRSGEDIVLAGRDVKIYSIDVTGFDPVQGHIDFDVFCSKGTYIRSLARDFGWKIGTGACLSALRRVSSGVFNISDAASIDELKEAADSGDLTNRLFLRSPMDVLRGFSKIILNDAGRARVANGALFSRDEVISLEQRDSDYFIIADNQENLIAIAEIDIEKWLIIYNCVFN
ncbi:MAG: tRNA pseudouridine(55) synthase TruB [Spirochaetae bacterium HGW-Spirochaetae-5]|nr:MAG: tRNA pseudouridine(55) synthase TruB [Spirochaetae bacterium HGW-Spirochaetae-5]